MKNRLLIIINCLLIFVISLFLVSCNDKNDENDKNQETKVNTETIEKTVTPTIESPTKETTTPIEDLEFSAINVGEIDKFNEYLHLFGRPYYDNGRLVLDHSASGAEVKFYGSNLSVDLVAAPATIILDVYIDGEFYNSVKVARNSTYKLAKDLEEKEHFVRFIKGASTASGKILVSSINTDGVILKHDYEFKLSIEIIGDSITCGAGILVSNGENTTYTNSDVGKAYSYQCISLLDADYSFVCTEGICAKARNSVPMNSIEMYQVMSLNNRSSYDFNKHFDIVIINLGTNDASYILNNPSYANEFYDDYLELITLVRSKNVDAEIICIYGHMGTYARVTNDIKKAVQTMNDNGDEKVHFFQVSSNNNGGGGHPDIEGGEKQGAELAQYIKNNILN